MTSAATRIYVCNAKNLVNNNNTNTNTNTIHNAS